MASWAQGGRSCRGGSAVAGAISQEESSMPRLLPAAVLGIACRSALLCLLTIGPVALPRGAAAIEMFTFYGDGSRIGLPSLEVPIEAYRGIPLRSDRIRARNRAMQSGRAAGRGQQGGITIRRDQSLRQVPGGVAAPLPEPR